MVTVRSAQVDAPNGKLYLTDRDVPDPGPGQVRITVEASGICHSDGAFLGDALPGLTFPLTPGHEIAGRIDALGDGVTGRQVGDRVAVGWIGGYCTGCRSCRHGDFVHCENVQIPGLAYRGGYAESVVVPATALARIPDGMSAVQAAPMACAGVSVFGALRHSSVRPGDLVAIVGLGGLGHLGVQFAAKMGLDTVVVARGRDKEALAAELGARHYIDAITQDVSSELQSLGGARIVLATAANSEAIAGSLRGLGPNGELMVLGIDPEPMRIGPLDLIIPGRSIIGHPSGTPADVEDTMAFAELTGIKAMVEEMPLEQAAEGFDRMLANEARFRIVLTTGV